MAKWIPEIKPKKIFLLLGLAVAAIQIFSRISHEWFGTMDLRLGWAFLLIIALSLISVFLLED